MADEGLRVGQQPCRQRPGGGRVEVVRKQATQQVDRLGDPLLSGRGGHGVGDDDLGQAMQPGGIGNVMGQQAGPVQQRPGRSRRCAHAAAGRRLAAAAGDLDRGGQPVLGGVAGGEQHMPAPGQAQQRFQLGGVGGVVEDQQPPVRSANIARTWASN
jgi:hypothetical protein